MATLTTQTRMAFWRIEIGGADITPLIRNLVEQLHVDYTLNGVTSTTIGINSKSFIEDYFSEGQPVSVYMGFNPTSLVNMFEGKIVTPPQGKADTKISYSVVAAGNALDLAKKMKQRRFQLNTKTQIINQVIAENGYTPVVDISDNSAIKIKNAPIQNNRTDLQFLIDQAEKWNCITWVDETTGTIYFVDADKAHSRGNLIKRPNLDDLNLDYQLGYRTTGRKNNVAEISWKFAKSQGVGQAVFGSDEDGAAIVEPEDFDLEIEGVQYKLKPEVIKKFREDYSGFATGIQLAASAAVRKSEDSLREYFVPVDKGSKTNKNKSHAPDHKRRNIELEVKLNIGDPYLRPPRKATIKAGTSNPRADVSDLPSWLYASNDLKKYNINQVKTGIQNGMLQTSMVLTR